MRKIQWTVKGVLRSGLKSCKTLLCAAMAVATLGFAWGADSDWTYTTSSAGVTITGYSGSDRNLTVPSVIMVGEEQKTVVAIGASAFKNKTGIKGITIPSSVKSIGDSAFYNCADLRTLKLNEGLTQIGTYAFYSTDLVNLSVPASVTLVGRYAFLGCDSLETAEFKGPVTGFKGEESNVYSHGWDDGYNRGQLGRVFKNCTALTDVTFAEGQTFVGNDMFENCTALVRVSLPSSVAQINEYAFNGCVYLKALNLPSGLQRIYNYAFYNCVRLESVAIPASTRFIGVGVFENDGQLATVTFDEGVTNIFQSAFRNCGVTALILPKSLKEVGNYAFFNCDSLKSVEFKGEVRGFASENNNIYSHGWDDGYNRGQLGRVFKSCNALERVKFADGQKYIGRDMFESCTKLTEVYLPDSVEEIWEYAFNGCSSLQEIELPESLWTIEDYAFYNCKELVSIVFPESLEEIHVGVFENDAKLVDVTFAQDGWLEKIYCSAFRHCGVTALDIPSSVDRIGGYAFFNCDSLKNAVFRGKVRGFESESSNIYSHGWDDGYNRGQLGRLFKSCNALENVVFANGQKFVGCDMFEACTSLTNVQFASTIERVYEYAFSGCSALSNVALPESLMILNDYAFYNCARLSGIVLPPAVEEIHVGVFENDGALASVTFAKGSILKRIYNSAFRHCGVTALSFPAQLDRVGGYAFYDCDALKTVVFSAPVRGFDSEDSNIYSHGWDDGYNRGQLGRAFKSCGALATVVFANGQEFVGRDMFEGCSSLASVLLPALPAPRKQTICEYAFNGCTSLNAFDIGSELSMLGAYAFNGCTALHSVTFAGFAAPLSVGENVFAGTKDRMTVYADPAGTGWAGGTTEPGFPASGTWQGRAIADVASKSPIADNPYDFYPQSPTFRVSNRDKTWKAPVIVTSSPYLLTKTDPTTLTSEIYQDDPVYLSFCWNEYWRGMSTGDLTNRLSLASGGKSLKTWSVGAYFDRTWGTNGAYWTNDVAAALQNLPIGEYTLKLELNAPHNLPETDYSNNSTSIAFKVVKRLPVKVTFNRNGGTGGTDSLAAVEYLEPMPTITVPTKKDLVFCGYWTTASGEGVQYYKADGTSARVSDLKAAATLYARWDTPAVYTVRFHKNDGTTTTSDQMFSCGASQNLAWKDSQLKWTREGYAFVGWALDAGSGLVKYANGEKVKDIAAKGEIKNLYAVWGNAYAYTVVYHRNYASDDATQVKHLFWRGSSKSLAWKESGLGWPTPTGYTFLGWATSAGGSVVYSNGQKVNNIALGGKTIHLYAKWKGNDYTVRYHYNYGTTDTTASQSFAYGTEQRLKWLDSGLKWTHPLSATFLGWSTSADGDVKYANGEPVKNLTTANNGVVHLYAKWNLITVRFHKNAGGADVTAMQYFKPNTAQCLTWKDSGLKWATPSGKLFVGWGLKAAATFANYANGESVKNPTSAGKTLDLYAIWAAADSYIVKFYRNYSSTDTTVAYQGVLRTGGNLAWKDSQLGWANPSGRTFLGWSKTRTATAAAYKNGGKVTGLGAKGATVNLYAIWSAPKKSGEATSSSLQNEELSTSITSDGDVASPLVVSPAWTSGYYRGTFADGSGTFDLLLGEFDEDGIADAYFAAQTEDDFWTAECEAEVVGETLVLTLEDRVVILSCQEGELVATE